MENEENEQRLYVGQTAYLLNIEETDKDPIVVDVVEDLGEAKALPGREYRLVDEKGKEYYVTYPKTITKYVVLSRNDYLDFLQESKLQVKVEFMKIMSEFRDFANLLEIKIENVKKSCDKYGHDYDEWKADSWCGVDEVMKSIGFDECTGYSRTCKVCGHKEYLKDLEKGRSK
jgi:hypothetical protein